MIWLSIILFLPETWPKTFLWVCCSSHTALVILLLTRLTPMVWPSYSGAILLPNGRSTTRCNLRTAGLLSQHKRHIYCQRGGPGEWDALHYKRSTWQLNDKWGSVRLLQHHHSSTWWFLWWRAADVGPDAKPKPQLPFINSHCACYYWGWGIRTSCWGFEVCR